MAATFRPRRGKKATAIANAIVLKKGEIFFETPDNGIGTGPGKIKMGDGITTYEQLPYFSDVDISDSPVKFTEAADADVSTLLDTIVTGNPLNTITGASKRLLRKYNGMINSKAASVNGVIPDSTGNINLQKVPLADNIYSPDNIEVYDAYLYRTSGGARDVSDGDAQLSFIKGNSVITGRVPESINPTYTSSHTPGEGESYISPVVAINPEIWRASTLGAASGNYTFTRTDGAWKYNNTTVSLDTYGITITGDVYDTDYFVVAYTKAAQGTITVAKPTTFKATGLNWYDASTMKLSGNYTLNSSGSIVASSGSTVGFVKCVPGPSNSGFVAYNASNTMTRIGWSATQPTTSSTGITVTGLNIVNNGTLSYIVPEQEGYIVFSYTGTPNICVHPSWTGGEDNIYSAYTTSSIAIPTKDINNDDLPTASYGMPAIGGVADVLSFDLKIYTQYIGRFAYSAANLETVRAMGVEYDWDSTNIFYVLPSPITYHLSSTLSGTYTVDDYGAEFFVAGSTTPIYAEHLYGQNLRDKLRRDVVTISPMTGDDALTDAQKATFRSNISAASAAEVTQLNNDLYSDYRNLNGIFQDKDLGTVTANNVNTFMTNLGAGSTWNGAFAIADS